VEGGGGAVRVIYVTTRSNRESLRGRGSLLSSIHKELSVHITITILTLVTCLILEPTKTRTFIVLVL
jgi:transcriptional regulator CtsR